MAEEGGRRERGRGREGEGRGREGGREGGRISLNGRSQSVATNLEQSNVQHVGFVTDDTKVVQRAHSIECVLDALSGRINITSSKYKHAQRTIVQM